MEIIHIPQVSLVDRTGRKIGVYSEDPDWWQQLKLKQRNKNLLAISPPSQARFENERKMSPVDSIEMSSSAGSHSAGSQARLIEDEPDKKPPKITVIDAALNQVVDAALNQASDLDKEEDAETEDENLLNVIGETPLHIAIMYDDFNMIKYLIEKKGMNVNNRSMDGKFSGGFRHSKSSVKHIEESKYEGLAYYGEYPLCFAACFSTKEIYDYLIDNGADPNLRDSNGNTLLHVLVINNKLDMFLYASNHPKKKAHSYIKNAQELTPINLAAKLGREEIFTKMLEINVMTFWQYSNIICSAYPLDGIDTVAHDGSIEKNAALSYIVNGETESHLDMLRIGVIDRLLEDKWSTYIQRLFIQRLVVSCLHLVFLTIAVYTREHDKDNLFIMPVNGSTYVRYISEIFVIIICIYQLGLQAKEIYGQGIKEYLMNLSGEPANVFYLIFNILIMLAIPFRFIKVDIAKHIEDHFVILAIPCGWLHLLFYFRVLKITGPFVVMIYKMIVGDILTFATIYIILLLGFATAFYYLYKNITQGNSTMNTILEAIMVTFQMTLGEFKTRLTEFDQIYYKDFTKIVFMLFMIMMHILLLNMLIAMMGNTYHKIISKSEKEYKKQWAHIVILLERSFSPDQLKKFQNKYCIKLTNKEPTNQDTVALMVIKRISSTKATKKQNTIQYWKKFYKAVKGTLKANNYTAVQLLEIWQNKEEISFLKIKRPKKTFDWATYDASKMKTSGEDANKNPMQSPLNQPPAQHNLGELVETVIDEKEILNNHGSHFLTTTPVLHSESDNDKPLFSSDSPDSGEEDNKKSPELFTVVPPLKKPFYPMLNNNKIYPNENRSSSSAQSTFSNNSDYFEHRRPIPIGSARQQNSDSYIKSDSLPTFPYNPNKASLSQTGYKNNSNNKATTPL